MGFTHASNLKCGSRASKCLHMSDLENIQGKCNYSLILVVGYSFLRATSVTKFTKGLISAAALGHMKLLFHV